MKSSWESKTGIHVALYSRQNDSLLNKQLTQDWSIRYWINNGCSSSKIVMGLALYGRTFRLSNSINTHIGASAIGPGFLKFIVFRFIYKIIFYTKVILVYIRMKVDFYHIMKFAIK